MDERLRIAVDEGKLDEVESLVRSGVDINAEREGETALSWAVSSSAGPGESLRRTKFLLELGARVAFEHGRGLGTSVHQAARLGYGEVLIELLRYDGKSAVNTFDDAEYTPLTYAVQNADLDMATLLLRAGADPNARDLERNGDPALTVLLRKKALNDSDVKMVELLLKNGADPGLKGWMKMSPLDHLAILSKESPGPELDRIGQLFRLA